MSSYASHVQRMTTGSVPERAAGLANLENVVDGLTEEQLLEVVRESGLLAALNLFLSGDWALASLKVLYSLMGRDSSPDSPTLRLCGAAIFDSPCFPLLKSFAASGGTLELKREAWEAIRGVSRMGGERLREFFDSPGMVALLKAGLESEDQIIAKNTTSTIKNLCFDETTATAIFDSPCFPSLKELAASGSILELKQSAWQAIDNVSLFMEEGRMREFVDSPGVVALLQAGLESVDATISEQATSTVDILCEEDETTASAVLDDHPDLVQTLVDTFCNSGFSDQFKCK